jgi:hypothetical protein
MIVLAVGFFAVVLESCSETALESCFPEKCLPEIQKPPAVGGLFQKILVWG